jgi:hypothetical protein
MVEAAGRAVAIPETRPTPLLPLLLPVCCRQRRGIACQRRRKLKSIKYERRARRRRRRGRRRRRR